MKNVHTFELVGRADGLNIIMCPKGKFRLSDAELEAYQESGVLPEKPSVVNTSVTLEERIRVLEKRLDGEQVEFAETACVGGFDEFAARLERLEAFLVAEFGFGAEKAPEVNPVAENPKGEAKPKG